MDPATAVVGIVLVSSVSYTIVSVTKLILGSRGIHLLTFNEHSHLEQAGAGYVTYR